MIIFGRICEIVNITDKKDIKIKDSKCVRDNCEKAIIFLFLFHFKSLPVVIVSH